MTDELLTSADLRRILRVGQNALTRYLRTLRHLRLGNPRTGPVRVRRSDLEAWMERRMVTPEEEHDPEAVRPRQSVPARQRRAVDRPTARRPRSMTCGSGKSGVDSVNASNQDMGMNTTTAATVTKADLTERKHGKGGSIVTVKAGTWSARYGVGPFVVIDMFERKNYTKADQVGVKPISGGLAHGIKVEDIVNVRSVHAD